MFKRLSPQLVVAQVVAMLLAFASPAFAATETSHSYSNHIRYGNQTITGNASIGGNLSVTGTTTQTGAATFANTALKIQDTGGDHSTTIKQNSNEAANRTLNVPALGADADIVVTVGAQTIGGAKTFSTPIAGASINNGTRRKVHCVPVVNGTIADGATYTVTPPVHHAGTLTGIKATIGTAIVGGTSTLAITKNGSTTLLSTANIDPTTIAANTATTLTLTGTGASLVFAAGDVIKIVHTAGTQTTDGVGEGLSFEFASDDL